MTRRPVVVGLLEFLTVALLGAQAQQPATRTDRLLGAYDLLSGAPIEGAKVTDVATGNYVLTSRTGTASLAFLPSGGGYVTVTKLGYESWMQFVHVSPSDTSPITLVLKTVPTSLVEMISRDTANQPAASPGLREFTSRLKTGLGHYIVDSTLRKNDNREMSDLILRVPGVVVTCSKRTPRRCVARTAAPPMGACPGGGMLIYLDGARLTDLDLLQIPVAMIGGVEVYSGATMPAQYNQTGGSCGAILFWSR